MRRPRPSRSPTPPTPARSARAARTARRPRSGPTDRRGAEADGPGWLQRSVPNLYPVLTGPDERGAGPARDSGLSSPADPLRGSARAAEPELFRTAEAHGGHEVIVNSPRHVSALADLDEAELAGALAAWRTRLAAHQGEAAYVHLCVNEGPKAGSTLPHTHAQLFALPFVPTEIARERERFNAYHERTMGGHLLEDVLVEEVRRRDRLVAIDGEAALICPWASRSPFELRLVPRSAEAELRARRRWGGAARAGARRPPRDLRRGTPAQPLGPHRAARDGRVPLASRHRAAALGPGRLRARHRSRHRLLPARAGRRRPAGRHPGLARGPVQIASAA